MGDQAIEQAHAGEMGANGPAAPVVGLSIWDEKTRLDLCRMLRDQGINPIVADSRDDNRWPEFLKLVPRKDIVCVVDDDPEMIVAATALGVDAVVWTTPVNQRFSWHLRAADIPDARKGIGYRLKAWKGTHHG